MQPPVSSDADPSLDPDALPPEAAAQGDLGRTPLLHLLVYMLDQALSGTLVLNAPSGLEHRVYFHLGAPAKIRTGGMVAPLDRVILELGLLDQATLQGTLLEISKAKALHGRQLVVRGLLGREQVVGVLALQLFSKLMSLFELPPETIYAYYDGCNLLSTYGGPELLPCEPLEAIMSGVRLRATDAVVDATIERIVDSKLGVHPDADARRFGLTHDEAAVLDLLRARRMTLDEVVAAGVAQERVVRLTIYAMAVMRYIDLGAGGRPPIGLATRSAVPVGTAAARAIAIGHDGGREPPQTPASYGGGSREPPQTPRAASRNVAAGVVSTGVPRAPQTPRQSAPASAPLQQPSPPVSAPVQEEVAIPSPAVGSRRSGVDVAARRAELEQRVQVLDNQTCFEILGLAQDAAQEQVQAAYFQAAKIWHPDRQPAELADVKPQIARLFARISDAYQTLSDPAKRAEHAKSIAAGGGTPQQAAQVARIVDAAFEFQKAEILLKKGDFGGAEALATAAVQADPEQPEYLATLAWIQFQRRLPPPGFQAGQETSHWDDLLRVLDAVLTKEPRYERGVFYRATMLKRSGRDKKAMADFKLAAELNPRNTDALREVRLFEMRGGQPGGPPRGRAEVAAKPAEGGLFNRLFKK